jgi:hypothetical protein
MLIILIMQDVETYFLGTPTPQAPKSLLVKKKADVPR